jgi:neurotransmitter:Na+ symporter, NSS family
MSDPGGPRESFASRLGLVATMIGVAVGLGNVWRFPYMVGKFGGASFVLVYALAVALIGVPALMAEWALGRRARRGPVGAFARAGLPGGRALGWFLFAVVVAATAYYVDALGWVLFYGLGEVARAVRFPWPSAAILPPETGLDLRSFALQIGATATVILACVAVLLRGLRAGIERASKVIMPLLFASLFVLIARALTLPGAGAGLHWFILKFEPGALTPGVVLAALGQAVFSLSLGGTFMVIYGSYLDAGTPLARDAFLTAGGDLAAGLLAGIAILPAVFAFGLEPASGPGLIFATLPRVFAALPAGWIFGSIFFFSLFGAAYLSAVAAFEVLVAGLTDNTRLPRRRAVWLMAAVVFVLALPPMINLRVFVPWDLTFGSGMQTLGSLLAVVAVGWSLERGAALAELAGDGGRPPRRIVLLYYWLRFVIPGAIVAVGVWWLATEVFGVAGAG